MDQLFAGGAGETVDSALDNVEYEIDLTERNAAKLRKALQRYVDAGRKVGGSRRSRSTTKSPSKTGTTASGETKAIRAWATANDLELSSRGRIPADIVEQYKAAH